MRAFADPADGGVGACGTEDAGEGDADGGEALSGCYVVETLRVCGVSCVC